VSLRRRKKIWVRSSMQNEKPPIVGGFSYLVLDERHHLFSEKQVILQVR
jgi:hypothetical protein